METFKAGEIAIVVRPGSRRFGAEVTIIEGPRLLRPSHDPLTGAKYVEPYVGYTIEHADGERFSCKPEWLRKKQPPRDDLKLVRWSECPWQPEVLKV